MTTKNYDDVKFALAENLTGKAKDVADAKNITKGLVAVSVKYGSPEEWDVEQVIGSPTEFIKEKANQEGVRKEIDSLRLKGDDGK